MNDIKKKYDDYQIFGIKQSPCATEGMENIMSSFCNSTTVSEVGKNLGKIVCLCTTTEASAW